MKILLIGPQGSGKSTQSDLLSQELNLPKISTGDIFRKLSKEDSEVSLKVSKILSEGKLVDDELTAKIVEKRLNEDDCKNGFIMDGYPRNIAQVQIFDPNFDKAIYLKVDNDELIKRLTQRGRSDDTPEGIKTRLDLYFQQTAPLLNFYREKGILKEVDGLGDVNQIQSEIRKNL